MQIRGHIRAVLAGVTCLTLIGCASTKANNQVAADAAAQRRVYPATATPRSSTPQARRMPKYPPVTSYRAPSVRTYSAAPQVRTSSARRTTARRSAPTYASRSYGSVPPPPPPPAINGMYSNATRVNPARAPASAGAVIRPASRPARTAASYALPQAAPTPSVKPLAPVRTNTLFRDSGSYKRNASSYGSFLRPKSSPARACKT